MIYKTYKNYIGKIIWRNSHKMFQIYSKFICLKASKMVIKFDTKWFSIRRTMIFRKIPK